MPRRLASTLGTNGARGSMDNKMALRFLLKCGAAYFLCISIAHVASIKIPGVFVYYNVTSYQYQDNIISFLAFGWAIFFYVTSNNLQTIKAILLVSFIALAGLVNITLSTDFSIIQSTYTSTWPYWTQIGLLGFYVGSLLYFSVKSELLNIRHKSA